MVNVPLVVGNALIPPGGEASIGDTPMVRRDVMAYTQVMALAVDSLPPSYMVAKAAKESEARRLSMEATVKVRRKKKGQ
jgi:hypothetical protein